MKVMVIGDKVEFKTIKDNLEDLYREIGCDYIEIVSCPINGGEYEVICDEEGRLKSDPFISGVTKKGEPFLVGNLIIARYAGEGELEGLEPDDMLRLANAIQYSLQQDKVRPIILLDF